MALTDFLKSIADAIRYAEGSTGEINAQMFAERIRALVGGQSTLDPDLNPDNSTVMILEVGKGDAYTYHTIKEAEADIEDGGTIRIHAGEYEEFAIGTVNKSITYEGVDKENCVVFNGLSDKMYSVFDLSGGNKIVRNLTIHQTHSNPQNPNTESVAYKAYGIHVDAQSNEGHTYLIENCIVKNKYFSCFGIGLWQDSTVIVKDCDMDLYDSNRDISGSGAFYCHNNTYSNGVTGQRLSLINNTIHANQSRAIRIDVASQEGSEMICEFINNTCSSDLYGITVDCVAFSTNEHTTLTKTSTGNNIAKLNYGVPASYTVPDGLKNTGYWFVAYDKSADKWYAVNSASKITRAYKHDSTLALMMTIDNGNSKNNGWTSDDGNTWTQTITDYVQYTTGVKLKNLNRSMYNNDIVLIDAWSDTEFSWDYGTSTEPDEPIVPNEPEEPTLQIPQTGTWQLKTTTPKKYVILGTDDDNQGNAKYFRMLRTYDFPYTMNVEAEKINADLGTDVDTTIFTDSDAPSIFPDGVTVKDLGKYIHDNNLGEVAQHGSSANTLWDSENLKGSKWTELYSYYTLQGGTKTEEELKSAIAELMASTDGSQDASYVEESRNILEEALGFSILTVGAWGGSPECEVDGIELDLNSFKGTSNYDWRKHNYFGVSSYVADFHINTNPYNISRMNDNPSEILKYVDMLPYGKVVEFFWHMPFHDEPDITKWRTLFESMKQMQNDGKIDVVTRYQYSQLGEYVDNPIKSITVIRNGSLNIGDTDSDSAYTVSVTCADGTTANPSDDMILDRSKVNTEESGTYEVTAYYRGFVATCNVIVVSAGYAYPDGLKDTDYWFVYKNDANGNWYCGNYSKGITEAKKSDAKQLLFIASESGGKINGWKSADEGITWEQVTTNRTIYNANISTNKTSDTDGGYQFNHTYNNAITWIETSGNFELNY